jgi:hypothetical protein
MKNKDLIKIISALEKRITYLEEELIKLTFSNVMNTCNNSDCITDHEVSSKPEPEPDPNRTPEDIAHYETLLKNIMESSKANRIKYKYRPYTLETMPSQQPCLHDSCPTCYGSGIDQKRGGICVHHITCTCPKCTSR